MRIFREEHTQLSAEFQNTKIYELWENRNDYQPNQCGNGMTAPPILVKNLFQKLFFNLLISTDNADLRMNIILYTSSV